jgi:hypothetical protein
MIEERADSALDASSMEKADAKQTPKKDSALMDLVFNLLIPVLILKKTDDFIDLDSGIILLIALAFPLGFGLKDFILSRKINIFSILGLVNILLTGVIGLLELPPKWVAVKEAAIPGILGLAVVISMRTRYPLLKTLLYNPRILKIDLIERKLAEHGAKEKFEETLKRATWYLAGSFFVSSGLNYTLAKIMVKTSPAIDRTVFNSEIASMWTWSMVVIVVPSMVVMMFALWTIFHGIKLHAGLTMEEVMVGMEAEPPPSSSD